MIVGCHYDSWTFGAVNPNSGTAILLELSKAFSELQSKGAVNNFNVSFHFLITNTVHSAFRVCGSTVSIGMVRFSDRRIMRMSLYSSKNMSPLFFILYLNLRDDREYRFGHC